MRRDVHYSKCWLCGEPLYHKLSSQRDFNNITSWSFLYHRACRKIIYRYNKGKNERSLRQQLRVNQMTNKELIKLKVINKI